jgi:hypothetical protein
MDAEEAQHLLALVTDQYGDDAAYLYRLSGLPTVWVVRICLGGEDWWLWDFSDFRQYRRAEKAARQRAREARKKGKHNKHLMKVAV